MKIDRSAFTKDADATGKIYISRCHRYGRSGMDGSPRPIVAVFIEGKDVVIKNARYLAKTRYFFSSQLPPEYSEQKRNLQPMYKNAKSLGKMVKYLGRGDALSIDNSRYSAPTVPACKVRASEIIGHTKAMNIVGTHPITDQGNNFMSHIATVTNSTEIAMAISAIKHTNNQHVRG